jgi:hypothetical protein
VGALSQSGEIVAFVDGIRHREVGQHHGDEMKIAIASIELILLSAVGVSAQTKPADFSYTVTQCRADEPQYMAKMSSTDGTQKILAGTMLSWVYEMTACAKIDAPNVEHYRNVVSAALALVADRMNAFLWRHHLGEQFFNEDAAGLRGTAGGSVVPIGK